MPDNLKVNRDDNGVVTHQVVPSPPVQVTREELRSQRNTTERQVDAAIQRSHPNITKITTGDATPVRGRIVSNKMPKSPPVSSGGEGNLAAASTCTARAVPDARNFVRTDVVQRDVVSICNTCSRNHNRAMVVPHGAVQCPTCHGCDFLTTDAAAQIRAGMNRKDAADAPDSSLNVGPLTDQNLREHLESLSEPSARRIHDMIADQWTGSRAPNPMGDDDDASVISGLSSATTKTTSSTRSENDAHLAAALSDINTLDKEQLLRRVASGIHQAKRIKRGVVRDWVHRVNKGNARVWAQAQLPSLQWQFAVDRVYRLQMESKGANINCFWKCDIKEVNGTWYQIPDLADMKRAVEYVTNLATIGELRDRS